MVLVEISLGVGDLGREECFLFVSIEVEERERQLFCCLENWVCFCIAWYNVKQ